ncbi:MAG: hypothetical protein Q8L88_02315 [Bacteroidota bacterium]|nr:hypothetical protein [Bacteroidota bacterium]
MNVDLSKVIAESVTIYVAERTSEVDPVGLPITADLDLGVETTWKRLGAHQKKTGKLTSPLHTTEICDGLESNHGTTNNITAKIVEMRDDIITTLESLINKPLDILLRIVETEKYYRLQRASLKFSPAYSLNDEETNGIDVTMMRGAKKLSTGFDQGTLQNYFNIFNPENI